MNVTLLAIGSFKEIEMTFGARFLIELKWFETRLNFLNLNDHESGQNQVHSDTNNIHFLP